MSRIEMTLDNSHMTFESNDARLRHYDLSRTKHAQFLILKKDIKVTLVMEDKINSVCGHFLQSVDTVCKVWTFSAKCGHCPQIVDTVCKVWTLSAKCGHCLQSVDTV